jgi:hypothetical protein
LAQVPYGSGEPDPTKHFLMLPAGDRGRHL